MQILAVSFRVFACLLDSESVPGLVQDFGGTCAAGSHLVAMLYAFIAISIVVALAPIGAAFMATPGSADAPLPTTKSSGSDSILLWYTLGA